MQKQREIGRLKHILNKKNPDYIKYHRKKSLNYYNKKKKDSSFMEKRRRYANKRKRRLKRIIIFYYSNGNMECNCCGEKTYKFLQIDHINNDGHKYDKKIRQKLYKWLFKNNFPKGYQVLCSNCNHGKSINGGICPHKGDKDE